MAQVTHGTGTVPSSEAATETTWRPEALIKQACAWAPAVGAVILLAYAVRAGMPASHVVRATLVVLGTQILPGALAWRAVRPREGWLIEDLTLGFAIGSVFAIGAQVVAGLSEQPLVAFSPLLVAIALMVVPVTRARILSARTRSLPWWWGPPVAGLFLLTIPQLRGYFRLVPLHWASGARAPHVDAYLHLALAAQLAHRGPTTFPWVKSEPLAYHWFSHAWVAQVSTTSGTGLDEVLFRFMPVLMPVVVVLSVAIAAVRLTGRYWSGPVAGALALIGGNLNVFGTFSPGFNPGFPIEPLSPSLAPSAPMLVGAVTVMALRWNRTMLSGGLVLLPVLCLGAAGTKGSTLPLLVVGLGLALVAMLIFNRARAGQVLGDLMIVIGCLVFALVVIFHGSAEGLHVSPSDAATQTFAAKWLGAPVTPFEKALVLAISVVGVLSRGAAAFVLPFSRTARRHPLSWLFIGAAVAGAGAIVVFAHPGWSQWYFARSAEPLLALGSAMGLVALQDAIRPARAASIIAIGSIAGPIMASLGLVLVGPLAHGAWTRALAMIAIGILVLAASGVVTWLLHTSKAERFRAAGAVLVLTILSGGMLVTWNALLNSPIPKEPAVSLSHVFATSRGQVDAARWIRDHSGINDMVMTNRHCTTPSAPVHCDSRRFVVAAFSERQVLLEGWTATPMAAKLGPHGRDSITVDYWQPELLKLNDGFIAHPTAAAAQELHALGVKWIYVDHTRPYAATLEPYATLRYRSPGVDVYEFIGTS